MADVDDVLDVGRSAGIPVEVSVSATFGDPYDGDVAPERIVSVVRRVVEAGAAGISLGDTTGMATPSRVWQIVNMLYETFGVDLPLNLHFHDTRGTGLANVLAALQAGVTEFDASVGGLGGSPYAPPGSNGNVATEDLVHMLTDMGVATDVDLDRVIDASKLAESLVGRTLRGQVTRVGPRWRVAQEERVTPSP